MIATVHALKLKRPSGYQPLLFSEIEQVVAGAFNAGDGARVEAAADAWTNEVTKNTALHPVRYRILRGWARNVLARNAERGTSPISVIAELRDLLKSPCWKF